MNRINKELLRKLRAAGALKGDAQSLSDAADHVFLLGDLNYRLEGSRAAVDAVLARGDYKVRRAPHATATALRSPHTRTHTAARHTCARR